MTTRPIVDLTDPEALDDLASLLRTPEWRSSEGLERLYEIVARTGRDVGDDDDDL